MEVDKKIKKKNIFTAIGLIVFILLLFVTLIILALEIARESKETFNTLVAIGVTNLLFIEVTLNICLLYTSDAADE